jgi:SAM-dependent methyltransferase
VFSGYKPSDCAPMSESKPDFSTDVAWEEWGKRDPYFAVITNPKFRRNAINQEAKEDLFLSGRMHVTNVMRTIGRFVSPDFRPNLVLDFGCGVGRTLIPFATLAKAVVGLDVSASMLAEAKINCDDQKVTNVRLVAADDTLSSLDCQFDLIHSFIVFQHIPFERGRVIFARLLDRLSPGGVGAIHFLYSSTRFSATAGAPPAIPVEAKADPIPVSPKSDPEMQMNPYPLTELFFIMQSFRITEFHVEFTDHGGEFGVYLFFAKP